jgi:hypothetical protein
MTRIELYRASLMAELPDGLFEHILQARRERGIRVSSKALAQIALALRRDKNGVADVQCCRHCGGVLRVRPLVNNALVEVVNEWLARGAVP